jgi:thymidylate kinase
MTSPEIFDNPLIIIDGCDYSGKSTLCNELANSIGGIVLRPIPKELSVVRAIIDKKCSYTDRYHFYVAASLYTYSKIKGLLISRAPVILDRWMFSTNKHHELLGVPKQNLMPVGLIPKSHFMFFTTTSPEMFVKRKLVRNEEGIDDRLITPDFMSEINVFLRQEGLVEINTDIFTPADEANLIISVLKRNSNLFKNGSLLTNL